MKNVSFRNEVWPTDMILLVFQNVGVEKPLLLLLRSHAARRSKSPNDKQTTNAHVVADLVITSLGILNAI